MAIVVTRQPNDTDDKIIGKFRRLIMQSDHVPFIKEKLRYLKPSAKRNRDKQSKKKRRPITSY